ncbi:PEGA domain-containing protein [bacterium]|nr:MAG: PEGA domain-containing protein [bacterium]
MKKQLLFVVLGIIAAACATITTGTKQLVTINSNVDGAEIYFDGILVGTTPFTGEVPKSKKTMVLKKAGYNAYTAALSTSLEPMFWGNIITGGTLGSLTDFASGAAYSYAPASYQVELYPNSASLLDFSKEVNLRKYAMLNMSQIAIDLANNSGTSLETLAELANLELNATTIETLKSTFKASNGDQVAFGNMMVQLLNS